MDTAKKIHKFLSHWYTRYLMSIELYMVEPWEKVVFHALFTLIFGLFWYFNHSIIFNGISQVRNSQQHVAGL